MMLVVF